MKHLKYMIAVLLVALSCCGESYAQLFVRYRQVLDTVQARSPRVLSLRAAMEAEQEGALQENVMDDPTVEFGYLWGSDNHRADFAVSQSFDFPTVYLHRRAMVRQEVRNAALRYRMELRDVLLQAVQLCIEWEIYNSVIALTEQQYTFEKECFDCVNTLFEEGGVTIVEKHRSARSLQQRGQELQRLLREREAVVSELSVVTGIQWSLLPINEVVLPSLSDADYQPSLDEEFLAGEVTRAESELKTVRSQWWPGLSLGYYSEKDKEQMLNGVKVGVTLPAWNNRHRMREAKAALAAARFDQLDRRALLDQRIAQLQAMSHTLRQQANDTRRLLDEQDMVSVLDAQLKEGVITRPDYLDGRIESLESEKEWLQQEREARLKLAELESISFRPE